jgi:DMSO/TMAO reductase YedYZ molybdopterin-dependent catalytic subunit
MNRLIIRGGGAGVIAGVGLVLSLLTIAAVLDIKSLPVVLADGFVSVLPASFFSFAIVRLQELAKPLSLVGIGAALILLNGGVGWSFAWTLRRYPHLRLPPWDGMVLGVVLWLLAMTVVVPLLGKEGSFASTFSLVPQIKFNAAVFISLVFSGYLLSLLVQAFLEELAPTSVIAVVYESRRKLLRGIAYAGFGAVAAAFFTRWAVTDGQFSMGSGGAKGVPLGTMPPELTPNENFYVVSKNLEDPIVNPDDWVLRLDGQTETTEQLNLLDLRSLPAQEEFVTLECVSNPVGGLLISTARWKGVRLSDLLDIVKLNPNVVDVSFSAQDGYSESLTLDKALSDEVMVAYEMNGEPLPNNHGFPARLLVPGYFGLKSVKWLKRIAPVNYDFTGFWQHRGWSDKPLIKTMSQFRIPANKEPTMLPEITLGGVAFAGARGIKAVEFSPDDGNTWIPARVQNPLSPYTWAHWRAEWTPPQAGSYQMAVRATDGLGDVQTSRTSSTTPDGATGHHRITVRAVPAEGV